jgi:hypothetical protein
MTQLEQELQNNFKETNNAQLIMLYSIGRYHEKYRFTNMAFKELKSRGFGETDLNGFDSKFSAFYDSLINSTEL